MIPRRFFWLLDLLVLCAAFLTAYALSPFLYVWLSLAPAEVRWLIHLTKSLASPDGTGSIVALTLNAKGVLLPLRELLWILFCMVPATVLFVEILGGYTPRLLRQSRARLAATSLFAPFGCLGLVFMAAARPFCRGSDC